MNLYKLLQQRADNGKDIRIGVIGVGHFSTMFLAQARLTPGMKLVGTANRRPEKAKQACLMAGIAEEAITFGGTTAEINRNAKQGKITLTDDVSSLIKSDVDVIVEVTGDPEAGATHAWNALAAGKHVVMVSVEADALAGMALRKKADEQNLVFSMAYGDQPGLVCELIDWARACGFEVVCAGKGTRWQPEYRFSTPDTVFNYWGLSKEQLAHGEHNAMIYNAGLDGTKSAIEMCAISNASGLIPQRGGLQFPPFGMDEIAKVLKPKSAGGVLEHSGTVEVAASEYRDGKPVSRDLRNGVFVVFRSNSTYSSHCFKEHGIQVDETGEYAALYRPYHLLGLELGISVASAVLRHEPTGTTSSFTADVAAIAKKDLKPGDTLDCEGGYTVYGRLVRADDSMQNGWLPVGLTSGAKVLRPVAKNTVISYKDVEVNGSLFSYKLRQMQEKAYHKQA